LWVGFQIPEDGAEILLDSFKLAPEFREHFILVFVAKGFGRFPVQAVTDIEVNLLKVSDGGLMDGLHSVFPFEGACVTIALQAERAAASTLSMVS
jgi:hypothetical protein